MIMVAGGDADPNVYCVLQRLAARCLDHVALRVGASTRPIITWTLADDRLRIDGTELKPTAVFLRYDVFAHLRDRRPESRHCADRWYHTVLSWILAHTDVAYLNRGFGARQVTKPFVVYLAGRHGLAVPESMVTNDLPALDAMEGDGWIVKPVNGGEYTRTLANALADAGWRSRYAEGPTIIQRRLQAPELRIYRVGPAWFAFLLRSSELDYRTTRDVIIEEVPPPADLTGPLGRLMDEIGLDFGAADFKACPRTGRYLFLEVNSAPMFAAFDRVVSGALSDAILDYLITLTAAKRHRYQVAE